MGYSKYVYLLAADGPCAGYYKIGIASSVKKRLKALTKMPFEITLLHMVQCEDAGRIETGLHSYFSDNRAGGEWFTLSPDQVTLITSCSSESDLLSLVGLMDSRHDEGGASSPIRCMLRHVAERQGFNAHQISVRAGISYPTVDRYWKDRANSYDGNILGKLCDLLECQPGDLLVRAP